MQKNQTKTKKIQVKKYVKRKEGGGDPEKYRKY